LVGRVRPTLRGFRAVAAAATSHLETDEASQSVTPSGVAAAFNPQQIRTLRLVPSRCPDYDADFDSDAADPAVFLHVLLGLDADPARAALSDLNLDGAADGGDIGPMVACQIPAP
jgi:hypothetical protein